MMRREEGRRPDLQYKAQVVAQLADGPLCLLAYIGSYVALELDLRTEY